MRNADASPLIYNKENCRYSAFIGTGGIGSGMFFALDGDYTLGREESRGGRLLNRRDYCKLHIVLHYIKTLLGKGCDACALGMVGNDETGKKLLQEMEEVGIDVRMVGRTEEAGTLFSFCFVYPDGTGGNMTTIDSASARVTPGHIDGAAGLFKKYEGRGMAIALPEVPIDARIRVLEYGTKHSLFRIASCTTGEMDEVKNRGILKIVDLFALNIDEAARIAGIDEDDTPAETIVRGTVEALSALYPDLVITITAGKRGNWAWDAHRLTYCESVPVEVVSTAGAGDAFLAGMITGLAVGLCVSESQELAALVSSLSVTSPHTIHTELDGKALLDCINVYGIALSERVREVLSVDDSTGRNSC